MKKSSLLIWGLIFTSFVLLIHPISNSNVQARGETSSLAELSPNSTGDPLLADADLPGFELSNESQAAGFLALAKRLTSGLVNQQTAFTNISTYHSKDLFTYEFVISFLAYPLSEKEVLAFDALVDDPQSLLDALVEVVLTSKNSVTPEQVPGLSDIGERSIGFTVSLGQEPVVHTVDFVWVRRGDILESIWVIHPVGEKPSADLRQLALMVDQRVKQRFVGTIFRPEGRYIPEITTHIPTPLDISTRPSVIATNIFLAALMMLPFVVAAEVFTRLSAERENSWKGIFRLPAGLHRIQTYFQGVAGARTKPGFLNSNIFKICMVMFFYGLVFSMLDRTWYPLSVTGLVLFLNMTVAYGMVGIADDIMQWRVLKNWGLPADINLRPTNIFIAAASTITSRLLTLVPGLMFGTPEALILEEARLGKRRKDYLLKISAYTLLGIGFGLWALSTITNYIQRQAISTSMGEIIGGLEGFLLIVFAVALENTFVQMLGMPGSFGEMIRKRNRWLWMLGLIAITFIFFHTLINPRGELAKALQESNVWIFLGATGGFVLFTFFLWSYLEVRERKAAGLERNSEAYRLKKARTKRTAKGWILLAISIITVSVLVDYVITRPSLERSLAAASSQEVEQVAPTPSSPPQEVAVPPPSYKAPVAVEELCFVPSSSDVGNVVESYLLRTVELVAAQYGAQVTVVAPGTFDPAGYAQALDQLTQDGCSLIIGNRYFQELAFQSAASTHPDQPFMLAGNSSLLEDPLVLANLWKVDYALSEGAYLAGYLAASASQAGIVGTFGGMQTPKVVSIMNCFNEGVEGYNNKHQAQVDVLGWDLASQQGSFADEFSSPAQGMAIADDLYKQDADILFPVAGADKDSTGSGALAAAAGQGKFILGADLDWGWVFPDSAVSIITSVETRYDQSLALAVDALAGENFKGGLHRGSLSSGEIRLAPLRSLAGRIPAVIQTEMSLLADSASLNAPMDENNKQVISGFIFDKGAGGENWPANSPLTFRVFADAGGALLYTVEGMTDSKGRFFLAIPFDLQPGMVIEASDCLSTRQTTLVPFSIDQIDVQMDTVSGHAPVGTRVFVIMDPNVWLRVTADNDGFWRADFSGLIDINPATILQATAEDEFGYGNGTVIKTSYNERNR